MTHQISAEDFEGFRAVTMIASCKSKRLWLSVNPLSRDFCFVICDQTNGDSLDVESGSVIVFDFNEAISIYNGIN